MSRPIDAGAEMLSHKGKSQSIRAWAKELKIKRQTIITRLHRGWSIADALSPKREPLRITMGGETLTVMQWSRRLGIPKRTIHDRLAAGARPHEALDADYARNASAD